MTDNDEFAICALLGFVAANEIVNSCFTGSINESPNLLKAYWKANRQRYTFEHRIIKTSFRPNRVYPSRLSCASFMLQRGK